MAISQAINPCSRQCPSRRFVELIGDKWALLVLHALTKEPRRNGELMREIEGISQKMLTQTIRQLELSGLVIRHDFKTIPPKVEYSMTELGKSFGTVIAELDHWLEKHIPDILNLPAR